jgi:hypothetical protein
MKKEIEKITNIMKEIILNNDKDEIYGSGKDFTVKYDTKNEFLFVSLSKEDLKDACYSTYCDPTLYSDVSMYDLECLDDYDDNDLQIIYDLLNGLNK